jgi:hypothetical protein
MKHYFETDMKAAACGDLLAETIHTEHIPHFSLPMFAGNKTVLGKVWDNRFRIRRRCFVQNSFAPLFHGEIEAGKNKTTIQGQFKMHFIPRIFMILWVGGALCAGLYFIIVGLLDLTTGSHHVTEHDPRVVTLLGPVIIAVVIGLFRFFRWWGRQDEIFLVEFLEKIFEAREVSGPQGLEEKVNV